MIRRLPHKLFRELLPFVKLYYGNIVSRNVLTPRIPSPFVIVLTLWSLLLGPGTVPTDTTLSNRDALGCGLGTTGCRDWLWDTVKARLGVWFNMRLIAKGRLEFSGFTRKGEFGDPGQRKGCGLVEYPD
ncbi:hypothetical protein Tco_0429837 [Tanacetum coccineum]